MSKCKNEQFENRKIKIIVSEEYKEKKRFKKSKQSPGDLWASTRKACIVEESKEKGERKRRII